MKHKLACIIDDNPTHVFLNRKYLEYCQVQGPYLSYNNGKEAFDEIKHRAETNQELPDLILLDLHMPVWDGWNFLDEFTRLDLSKEVTIFIVTNSEDEEDWKKAEQYNLKGRFFIKPISPQQLKKAIEALP